MLPPEPERGSFSFLTFSPPPGAKRDFYINAHPDRHSHIAPEHCSLPIPSFPPAESG